MTDRPIDAASEGILAYGAYVPCNRLERATIAGALGVTVGPGRRAAAGFDEDTTSMAVEAARVALRHFAGPIDGLQLSTVDAPYMDRTNATVVHAALDLPHAMSVADRNGSVRSGVVAFVDALHLAGRTTLLTVASDIRTGLPGSDDEASGGDAAVAYVTGRATAHQPVLAELVSNASVTEEVFDRWRVPGEHASRVWEDRFAEFIYGPLIRAAYADALKRAGLTTDDVDHLAVTGTQPRATREFLSASGARASSIAETFSGDIGFTGAAHFGLVVADVLDRAEAGDIVVAVSVSDGVDVAVLRATAALPLYRQSQRPVRASLGGTRTVSYPAFLSWRGQLRREPPRRPDPPRPAAPPSLRFERWKFGLVGSLCLAPMDDGTECGTRHLPPQIVCRRCHRAGYMEPKAFADLLGTVTTFTVDHLTFSPSPPLVGAVIDFDGGGRYRFELTDLDADVLAIGDRVEMTFRRFYTTADGVHNYFWKARPKYT